MRFTSPWWLVLGGLVVAALIAGADEVGDDDDQRPSPRQRRGGVEHHGEVGGDRGRGRGGGALELVPDAQGVAAAGAGRHDPGRDAVVQQRPDAVAAAAEQPGQGQGELGQHVVLAAAGAADRHRGRPVEH